MGKSSPTKIQVKHIPDKALIDLVDKLWNAPTTRVVGGYVEVHYPYGVTLANICKYWDTIPPKVIQAKLKKLIEKNFLDGCHCGCSTGIRVIHESDLPIIRWFDPILGEWKERRIDRRYYHIWGKNYSGPVEIAGH